jgi:predicted secreted protein
VEINRRAKKALLCVALITLASTGWSQTPVATEPRNIVQLSANGTVEAQQDWLTLTLSVTRQGSDASSVQSALRDASEAALTVLKKTAQAGAMEVRSGSFNLQPRYTNEGKINGWAGTTELIIEGNDFARISSAAAKAQTMAIGNLTFGLSRAARVQLENQAQALAIEGFKLKAAQIARGFGFADYGLREINVQSADQQGGPVPRMMAMRSAAMMADAAPMPMEAGKSLVIVTVSGAVQLK